MNPHPRATTALSAEELARGVEIAFTDRDRREGAQSLRLETRHVELGRPLRDVLGPRAGVLRVPEVRGVEREAPFEARDATLVPQ